MLLACVMLFSVLVAPEVEAKEETVTQIAEMRAMGQFDFELPPKTLMKANSSFPMERGETVKITASYSYIDPVQWVAVIIPFLVGLVLVRSKK